MTILAINGSIQAGGKTGALAAEIAAQRGGEVLDLASLDAEALLGRRRDEQFDTAIERVRTASKLAIVTPVYRATYSGVLKAFFDLLPQGALAGSTSLLAATGAAPAHFLAIDTGLRPLVASLEGWAAPTALYATGQDFDADGRPNDALRERVTAALLELDKAPG